jgi:carboxylesterase
LSEVKVLEGCEEFAFGEGPVGALLVHGFTGSPQGLRALGRHLANQGIAVAGPRLPGHGTTWQDLSGRTSDEWKETVERSFDHLRSQVDEIFLVGLSFGAALSLDLAARRSDDVDGIVTLAGMVFSKDPRRFLAPVIKRVTASLPGVGNDIADPAGKEIAYDRLPTAAADQVLAYVKKAKAALPWVNAPILVMHGRNDHTVHPSNAEYIYEHVGSTDKELLWLERSYHVVTLDYDKDVVAEKTFGFIKERAKNAL